MAPTMWEAALLAAVGVASGFLNVMAGGGSLLTVPVMVFLGIPGPVANGTNRIAILAQNVSAIATFARRGFSDLRLSLSLGLCAVPGAVLGGLLIGLVETLWSAYFSIDYKDVAAFSILAIVLIFLPSGMLGRPDVEKV